MSGLRLEMSVRWPCLWCIGTMEGFQAIRCEEAWSIQDTLEKQKCFPELGQASSLCRDEGAHVYTTEGKKIAKDRLKDLFLFQNAFFGEESQNASITILCNAYNIFRFELLQNQHLGISKMLKNFFRWMWPKTLNPSNSRCSQKFYTLQNVQHARETIVFRSVDNTARSQRAECCWYRISHTVTFL